MPSTHANTTRRSPYEAFPSSIQRLAHVVFFFFSGISVESRAYKLKHCPFLVTLIRIFNHNVELTVAFSFCCCCCCCCCFEISSRHAVIFNSTEGNRLLKEEEVPGYKKRPPSLGYGVAVHIDNIESFLVFESERLKTFFEPRGDGMCGSVKFWSAAADITPEELGRILLSEEG
ncbi:hypothetical protein O3P69_020966 [Scylla paramamosain]|uniref:Uncharacterized protein n=1 Tax=Scylla paramamosain TaxID=85552 RepID=A0AAW0SFP9_SCYPA